MAWGHIELNTAPSVPRRRASLAPMRKYFYTLLTVATLVSIVVGVYRALTVEVPVEDVR